MDHIILLCLFVATPTEHVTSVITHTILYILHDIHIENDILEKRTTIYIYILYAQIEKGKKIR